VNEVLQHRDLTGRIIGLFFEVYGELGHGFLESVYEEALAIGFKQAGLRFERQKILTVWFRGYKLGEFKADMVVEDQVLLELKAGRAIERSHEPQLLNYLRCSEIEVGLILNFGPHPQFRRLAFDNRRKKPLARPDYSETSMKVRSNLPVSRTADGPSKKSASSAKSAAGLSR
jgi:GxxExxY protein